MNQRSLPATGSRIRCGRRQSSLRILRSSAAVTLVCRAAIAVLLTSAIACSTGSAPPPPTVIAPQLTATGHAQRVILVSFDGLSADELQEYGTPAYSLMAAHATRVTPVTPTVTSTTHAAILTGAAPERTGIVSNQFHIPGTPAGRIAMGVYTEIDAETLIDAVRRAGKRVGCITFPTVDATTSRRSADWGLIWHSAAAPSRMIRLTRSDFHSDWLPPMWGAQQPRHTSFSPVMRARIEWSVPQRTREDVDIAAYDTTDDHVRNYDTFYVEHAGSETLVDSSRWFAVSSRLRDGVYGSWSKLLAVDPSLDSMTVYWGAINRTEGYPDSFVQLIDDEAGFWPGVPDEVSAKGWIVERNGIDAPTMRRGCGR